MPNGDTGTQEIWAWLQEPLRQMKAVAATTPWEQVREELLRDLGLTDPALHPVTEELFERLGELDETRRTELLVSDAFDLVVDEIVQRVAAEQAQYAEAPHGEAAQSAEVAAEPGQETAAYDEAAWNEYVATNLGQWSGEESAWPAFHGWFRYYAEQRGLAQPATRLLEYFDAMDTAGRVAAFAQYGVTIVPPEPAATAAPTAAEPGAEPDEAAPGAGPALDATTEAVVAEIVAANPEFAALSEERRRELAAEVLREQEEEVRA
jgi:hypothetical protein